MQPSTNLDPATMSLLHKNWSRDACKPKITSWYYNNSRPEKSLLRLTCSKLKTRNTRTTRRIVLLVDKDFLLDNTKIHFFGCAFLCNISSVRHSVSSPDETMRRELKIRLAAEYFDKLRGVFIWWWNTVSNAWYYFSNKMVLEGEINDAKMSSFSSDFQALIKH